MSGLQQYVAFAATARHGGFAAAARDQGVTPSTIAKAVGRLEAALGVKLFHRTTRQVTLTPDGERLYVRCRRVLAEVEDLQAEASGTRAPAGTLHVTAPIFYGKRFVLPLLAALVKRHPAIQLQVRLSDRNVDLVAEGVDLAVRIGAMSDTSLVARKVDQQTLVVCAGVGYLARHGTPKRIEDLAGHAAISFRMPTTGRERPWQFAVRGRPVELSPPARLRVDDTESLADAARLDLGLCQLPAMIVEDDIRRGVLREVLPEFRPEPMPIQLVYSSGRLMPARVRAAIEALEGLRRRSAPRR